VGRSTNGDVSPFHQIDVSLPGFHLNFTAAPQNGSDFTIGGIDAHWALHGYGVALDSSDGVASGQIVGADLPNISRRYRKTDNHAAKQREARNRLDHSG